jgi:hypothetical protein
MSLEVIQSQPIMRVEGIMETKSVQQPITSKLSSAQKRLLISLSLCLGFAFITLIFYLLPMSYDWNMFQRAVNFLLAGKSPYLSPRFSNPAWILIPLIPFALLPAKLGSALISACVYFGFGFTAYKMGAKPLALVALALSAPIFCEAQAANINWLVSLGLLMPPQIGLFFLLAKPQVGGIAALFILIEIWRDSGFRKAFWTFAPVMVAFALSLVLYGPWLLQGIGLVDTNPDTSTWPKMIPVGLALLALALRKREVKFAILSSPFLAPYSTFPIWGFAYLGLLPDNLLVIVAVIGSWIYVFLNHGWMATPGLPPWGNYY